jgi:hypothetical protein
MDLGSLKDLTSRFSSGYIRAGAHLTPFAERAANAHLRPNADDQRDADVEKPVVPEAARVKHVYVVLCD